MPDPVLPVVSLTLAALGFLATVRNGIDLIIRDKDHVKGFVVEDLVLPSVELTLLSDRLVCWRRLWYVRDGVSNDLFVAYWGGPGCAQIMEILSTVEHLSRSIAEEFQAMYGVAHSEAQGRFKNQRDLSEKKRRYLLQTIMKDYRIRYSTMRRVKLALLNSPTFQRHLKTLGDLITKLESLSISKFEKENQVDYDKSATRQQGLRSILLGLADQAGHEFASLISRCKEQTLPSSYAIDFHLDLAYGMCGASREEYITDRSIHKGFPFYLRLLEDSGNTCITILKEESDYLRLSALFERRSSPPDPSYALDRRSPFSQRTSCGETTATESLRDTLAKCSRGLLKSQYHHFSLAERYKLIYELCETALILLATTSFCDLCICSIQRHRLDAADGRYEHYFRVNSAHQADRASEASHANSSWCTRKELPNMHFRRLGIVLAEISTGRVVSDAKYDNVSREVVATIGVAGEANEKTKDTIAEYVEDAAGVDLALAVNYCLRGGASPEKVENEDLARFYNRVVAPYVTSWNHKGETMLKISLRITSLYIHYRNQILEPQRQDKSR